MRPRICNLPLVRVKATSAEKFAGIRLLSMIVYKSAAAWMVTHIWYFWTPPFIVALPAFAYTTPPLPGVDLNHQDLHSKQACAAQYLLSEVASDSE